MLPVRVACIVEREAQDMTKLSLNVNKIATLRNARSNDIPDIVHLSAMALDAGADGITVHPRPDERHISAADVGNLARLLERYPTRNTTSREIPSTAWSSFANACAPTRRRKSQILAKPSPAITDGIWSSLGR